MNKTTIYRNIISSVIVALVAFGNGFQGYLTEGTLPNNIELLAIAIPAVILLLNDIKSRITPIPEPTVKVTPMRSEG